MILKFRGFNVLGHASRNENFFRFLFLIILILSLRFLFYFFLSCILCFSISQVPKLRCFHKIENSHLVSCLISSSWWLSSHCYLSWRLFSKLILFLGFVGRHMFHCNGHLSWGAHLGGHFLIVGCVPWWSSFVFGEYSLVLAINLLIVCFGDHLFVVHFGDLSFYYLSS